MHLPQLPLRKLGLSLALALLPTIAPAAVFVYSAFLDGPSEVSPNASPGTGTATVFYDDVAHTMRVVASFSGLVGNTTAAHIHAPTVVPLAGAAGVATTTPSFPGFPLGVKSGAMDMTFDLSMASTYNAAFITGQGGTVATAEAALAAAFAQGKSYFNIHTIDFPGGEIRGFLVSAPDHSVSAVLFLIAFGPLLVCRRFLKR